jgi:hypothetical protein
LGWRRGFLENVRIRQRLREEQQGDVLLAVFRGTTDASALRSLALVLQAFPARLADSQVDEAVDIVLTAIKQTADPGSLRSLAQALQALPAKLADTQAQAAIALQSFVQVLPTLAAKLADARAQVTLESILAAIRFCGFCFDCSLCWTENGLTSVL